MKINKRNPKHWLYLSISGFLAFLSLILRPFFALSSKPVLGFYGHQFNGNLAAIYHHAIKKNKNCCYFLLDPNLANELKGQGINAIALTNWKAAFKLAQTQKMLTDHGLHALILLKKTTNIRFFDVWHGVPFKGFSQADFKLQQQYTETWVTSDYLKQLYIDRFKFDEKRVKAIGYARTDILINNNNAKHIQLLKRHYGLAENKKVWLFAPTWKQDNNQRNIFPFNKESTEFLNELNQLAEQQQAHIIFRTHLNSSVTVNKKYSSISLLSANNYPDTESILLISDVLICDWSSIAFDFILLDRPTLFLNTPAPFSKGFSLDATHRFGEIINSFEQLLATLKSLSISHETYWENHQSLHESTKFKIYDTNADGNASRRALRQIESYNSIT